MTGAPEAGRAAASALTSLTIPSAIDSAPLSRP
jgi:hypothetical protein